MKIKLEPTSSVVFNWSKTLYNSSFMKKNFFDYWDSSSGNELNIKCLDICSWCEEVIINRKYKIRELLKAKLSQAKNPYQIIFLASGKCPLPFYSVKNFPNIKKVFEIDISQMKEKNKIYEKNKLNNIICLKENICSENLLNILIKNSYNESYPTIIIIEGISYYISENDLANIIKKFSHKKNYFILEYLLNNEEISKEYRSIPRKTFLEIQKLSNLEIIRTYNQKTLEKMIKTKVRKTNLHKIEKERLEKNVFFKNSNDSWIDIIDWESK